MAEKKENAYLTVYLALIMAVMLSLCLAMIEGVRSSAVYLEAECVTDIGLNSIFAEYHRELLEQYNLFAIDSSYGTDCPGVMNTKDHLSDYLRKNMSCEDVFLDWLMYRDFLGMSLENVELDKVLLFTDDGGAVFRRRAAEAVKDDIGLELYHELKDWMRTVEVNELSERDIAKEKEEYDNALAAYDGKKVAISEKEWRTVKTDNPTSTLEGIRAGGILRHVAEDPDALSSRKIAEDDLIEARMAAGVLNQGNGILPEGDGIESLTERFLFQEYLMRYMGNYRNCSEEDALQYQIEYLIAGKEADVENLRSIADRLCAMREVSNVLYLFADEAKQGAAKTVAAVLAALMMIPEAEEVIAAILVFGWAYAESIYDVKCLLKGGKVPLMKDAETWHYGLEGALGLDKSEAAVSSKGLSYEDYLRILMMLEQEDKLTVRAMNMMEADIRLTPGNGAFRLDGCIDDLEACVRIRSDYGYSCEITRQKGYTTQ